MCSAQQRQPNPLWKGYVRWCPGGPTCCRASGRVILTFICPSSVPLRPYSDWPALLEECEAVGGRVQQRASAPLLPDPVQRGQCWSLLSPGSPLCHHQLQDLQVCAAGCAEDRWGASFQVSRLMNETVQGFHWKVCSIYLLNGLVCVSDPVFVARSYLEMEIALSQDQISKYADKILLYTNTCMRELRRLFLVQDLVDSLKVCSTTFAHLHFFSSSPRGPLTQPGDKQSEMQP